MTLRTSCEAANFSQNPQISYESCGLYYSLHLSAQKHTMCVLLVKFVLKFLHRKQILRLHVLRLSETISCFLSAALYPAHCTDQLCPCYASLHPQSAAIRRFCAAYTYDLLPQPSTPQLPQSWVQFSGVCGIPSCLFGLSAARQTSTI